MIELNTYIIEKLHLDKNTKVSDMDDFLKTISELFDWEELKESENIKKLFKDMHVSKIEDFKYLYRGTTDYPNKGKLSEESKDFIEKYIPSYGKYSKQDRDKINDIVASQTSTEVILDNGNLSKYVERYCLSDRIIGFSITDDTKSFIISGVV